MYSFSYLEPVCCSMSSSTCCLLTFMVFSRGRSGGLVFPSLSKSSINSWETGGGGEWGDQTPATIVIINITVVTVYQGRHRISHTSSQHPWEKRPIVSLISLLGDLRFKKMKFLIQATQPTTGKKKVLIQSAQPQSWGIVISILPLGMELSHHFPMRQL